MTLKTNRPISIAPKEYEQDDENLSRQAIDQNFQDVSSDVHSIKTQSNKDASLSLRKYQFLLLGASNG